MISVRFILSTFILLGSMAAISIIQATELNSVRPEINKPPRSSMMHPAGSRKSLHYISSENLFFGMQKEIKSTTSSVPMSTSRTSVTTNILGTPIIFEYTGSVQTWTVPSGITRIQVDVYGAQGGGEGGGGLGGYVSASIPVTPSQVLYVYVGQQVSGPAAGSAYNGGGNSGKYARNIAGPGGGASDIRISSNDMTARFVVAGGGGGVGTCGTGGAGGGISGGNGFCTSGDGGLRYGYGGLSTAGGQGGGGSADRGGPGILGGGGDGTWDGGGGGGGYFGGGGGGNIDYNGYYGGGGGGGSSYLSSTGELITNQQGVRTGNGVVIITPTSNSQVSSIPHSPSVVYTHFPLAPGQSVPQYPVFRACGFENSWAQMNALISYSSDTVEWGELNSCIPGTDQSSNSGSRFLSVYNYVVTNHVFYNSANCTGTSSTNSFHVRNCTEVPRVFSNMQSTMTLVPNDEITSYTFYAYAGSTCGNLSGLAFVLEVELNVCFHGDFLPDGIASTMFYANRSKYKNLTYVYH